MKTLFTLHETFSFPRVFFPLLSFLLVNFSLFSQDTSTLQSSKITGRVTSMEKGEALPGVNILIKGTSVGTTTDVNGNYSIEAPKDATLIFSYIGFLTEETPANGRSQIDIQMAPNLEQLNEVVVVGYGTQKKRDVIGAIASVSSKDIEHTVSSSVQNVLQGKVAGVEVVSNSGEPGGGITVKIRGVSTLNSGTQPLYIVDGVPIQTEALTRLNNGGTSLNPLFDIDPSDIESVEILKDAASGAIYGSRAANGVVLITTKRGKTGRPSFSINVNTSIQNFANRLGVLNANQYRQLQNEASFNNMEDSYNADSLMDQYSGDVDAQNELYQRAFTHKYDLKLAGGNQKLLYSLSGGLLKQEGIVKGSDLDRIHSRANIDYQIFENLKIGSNLAFSKTDADRASQGAGSGIEAAVLYAPLYAIYSPEGKVYAKNGNTTNPIAAVRMIKGSAQTIHFTGNEFLEWQPIKGLTLRSNLAFDYSNIEEDIFRDKELDWTQYHNSFYSSGKYTSWLNENIATYARNINRHNFSILGGITFQKWLYNNSYIHATGYRTNTIKTINAATIFNSVSTYEGAHSLQSVLGRINYDFDGRYLFAATFRRDGSSRFGSSNRWGNFPSVQLGWRFTSEKFINWPAFLNEGKIRASYGLTGNESIGDYVWRGTYGLGYKYMNEMGIAPLSLFNPDLRWETSKSQNFGIDIALFKGRLDLTGDYYIKTTKDLLFQSVIPQTSGFETLTTNLGELENKGFEIQVTGRPIMTEKITWVIQGNLAANRNKVIELPESKDILRGVSIIREGEQVGTFFGYVAKGVFSTDDDNKFFPADHPQAGSKVLDPDYTGDVVKLTHGKGGPEFQGGDVWFEDLNKDGIIDEKDRTIIGHSNPDLYGGLSSSLTYKNLTLSVYFNFVNGGDLYNGLRRRMEGMDTQENSTTRTLNRWQKEGDETDIPMARRRDPMQNARTSTRWIEDASYIRCRFITLQYEFPKALINKLGIRRSFIFVQASNPLTFTKYKGYNPEANSSGNNVEAGVDWGGYPISKGYNVGLNLEF